MSRIPPGQKRDRMTVDSGMALDANDERYDITAWRKALAGNSIQALLNQATIIANQETMIDNQTSGDQLVGIVDEGGARVIVDVDGHMATFLPGEIVTAAKNDDVLGAAESFVGPIVDILDYALFNIFVYSDQASATDGLLVEWSTDGINWDANDTYTIPASTGKTFSFQCPTNYARITYTNGSTPQTQFRLQAIAKHGNAKPSSHRIADPIIDDDDAELVTSVLKAKANGDGYANIEATASGNLRVSNAEDGLAIAKGDVVNTTFVHKFGNAPDFDQADSIITVWDGADDGDINAMAYIYSTTAAIDSVSSSSGSDTFDLQVEGLDANYNVVIQIVALTGQTRKALTTPLIRVFRMQNENSVDNIGHIYCYENTALSGGIPIDNTKVRAVMQPGNNQTLMAVYTVPAGKTGYMRSWFAAVGGASKSSSYIIDLRARQLEGVFQLKHRNAISDTGTSSTLHEYTEPEVFLEKTDIEIRCALTAVGAVSASVSAGFDMVLVDN